jgi:hypothetical protein
MFARDMENLKYREGLKGPCSQVFYFRTAQKEYGYIWPRFFGRLLAAGKLKAHLYGMVPGGLMGI